VLKGEPPRLEVRQGHLEIECSIRMKHPLGALGDLAVQIFFHRDELI
jgi:hypothetical protein